MDSGKHLGEIRVLLVDDDVDCRQFLAMALEQEGMKVVQAPDAEAGIEELKLQKYDCVTTDKNLPGMDGVSFIKHIRDTYGDLPVLLITGQSSVRSAIDAFKLGAQDYLVKPLEDGEELVGAIWRAVDHHRLSLQHSILQERLVRAQRLESLGILAGGVAHDLNNILCPMLAFPQLIIRQIEKQLEQLTKRGSELSTELKDFAGLSASFREGWTEILEELRQMEESGKRAASVVQDLLSLSVRGQLEKQPVNLNDLIRDHLRTPELVERRLTRPELIIETKLEKTLNMTLASTPHLQRVIANLVKNAIEAIDKHRKDDPSSESVVTITTFNKHVAAPVLGYEVVEAGNYVVIQVADSGTGIEEDKVHRIFEPFFTSKKMSSTSGSGLGLAIVRGIIKDHNGYVDVKTQLGKGTAFSIYFPATEVKPAPAPAAEEENAAQGKGEHIMVCDDEPAARFVAKRLLTMLGYKVTVVSSGHEAVDHMKRASLAGQKKPYDLVLLDMIMGEGQDGLETYKKILTLYPDVKTILVSGYSVTEKAKEMMDSGATCLPKPYSMKDLSKAIRERLDA